MDAATIQKKIYAGRGKAALRVGLPCQVFRPLASAQPLANPVSNLHAAFNAADSNYLKPNLYGKPVWYVDMDGRLTQPGDYLVRISDGHIWFIAAQQQLVPIVAVDCNRSVYVSRQLAVNGVGDVGYSGLVNSPANNILGTPDSLWPCSILVGGRALSATGLPSDVKEAGWRILLPPSLPEPIQAGDILTDDLARRFAVESSELSDLGYRLTVNEVHA